MRAWFLARRRKVRGWLSTAFHLAVVGLLAATAWGVWR